MTFTSACNYAKKCAADSAEITTDQIEEKTKKRNIVTARYVAMALMKKHTHLTDKQIGDAFDNPKCRDHVNQCLRTVQGHIELYNKKSVQTEIFKVYRKAEWQMERVYKPKYHTRIPNIK